MPNDLPELLELALEDPAAVPGVLGRMELTADDAQALADVAERAASAGEWLVATRAGMVSGTLFSRLGAVGPALLQRARTLSFEMGLSRTVEEYDELRGRALEMIDIDADGPGVARVRARSATVALEASWHASDAAAGPGNERWHLQALGDAVVACEAFAAVPDDPWVPGFVRVVGKVILEGLSRVLGDADRERADAALRALAAGIEAVVPVDYEDPDDPQRTAAVAELLTGLADRYMAEAPALDAPRLEFALRRAEELGDAQVWAGALGSLYVRSQRLAARPAALRAMRTSLLSRIDDVRAQFRSRAGRLWAAQELEPLLGGMLADVLADPNRDLAEAFALLEASKARALLDDIRSGFVPPPAERRLELVAAERALLSFGAPLPGDRFSQELALISALPIGSPGDHATRARSLAELERRYAEMGTGYRDVAPAATLAAIRGALEPDELLVEYAIPYGDLEPVPQLWLILVTRNRCEAVAAPLVALGQTTAVHGRIYADNRAPVDFSPLSEAIARARTAVVDDQRAVIAGEVERLRQVLIEPITEAGFALDAYARVIVVPHRMLHPLPWGALLGTATVVPSASVWLALTQRAPSASRHFVAVGDPFVADPGVRSLPEARDEAREVAAALSAGGMEGETLVGPGATESRLRERVVDAAVVHIAAHGSFPGQDAYDTQRVLLAADTHHDGALHADELRTLPLDAAWLVALSICNGGLYRIGPGDEPYGLIPAALAAGASNVIAPLWEIDDGGGRRLMTTAFAALLERGPAAALRAAGALAGLAYREAAGFLVIGSGRAR